MELPQNNVTKFQGIYKMRLGKLPGEDKTMFDEN